MLASPAFADTQADIAEAERQIELRQLAKEIRKRANKRADDAVMGSSVYKAYETAQERWKPTKARLKKVSPWGNDGGYNPQHRRLSKDADAARFQADSLANEAMALRNTLFKNSLTIF